MVLLFEIPLTGSSSSCTPVVLFQLTVYNLFTHRQLRARLSSSSLAPTFRHLHDWLRCAYGDRSRLESRSLLHPILDGRRLKSNPPLLDRAIASAAITLDLSTVPSVAPANKRSSRCCNLSLSFSLSLSS